MTDINYPKVRVTDAPGYADFDGELIQDVLSVDGRRLSFVGFEWEGKRDFVMVPASCVRFLVVDDIATKEPASEGMSTGEFVNLVTNGPNWNR